MYAVSQLFVLSALFITTVFSNYSWLTVVLVDFNLREQCVSFWNEHRNCINPSLRVIAKLSDTRHSSAAWPITANLLQKDKLYFTTQWNMPIDQVLISSQIEGENVLNPFGLAPKCDHGFASFVFNETVNQNLKPGQTTNTRVAHIDSQCFNARFLIRVDDKCPHCPKVIKSLPIVEQGFLKHVEITLASYDLNMVNSILICICIMSIVVFCLMLDHICRNRKSNYLNKRDPSITSSTDSLHSTVSVHPIVSCTASSARIAKLRQIPTLTSIRYEQVSEDPDFSLKNEVFQKTFSNLNTVTFCENKPRTVSFSDNINCIPDSNSTFISIPDDVYDDLDDYSNISDISPYSVVV